MGNTVTRNIRYLKQGMVTLEIPEGLSIEEEKQLCLEYLNGLEDKILIRGMSDCTPIKGELTSFDLGSFKVEAIENLEYHTIFSTPLWERYLDDY